MNDKRAFKAIPVKTRSELKKIEKLLIDFDQVIEAGFTSVQMTKFTHVYYSQAFLEWCSCHTEISQFDTMITIDQLKEMLSKP